MFEIFLLKIYTWSLQKMNIHEQLAQPYVISPIDNNTYCRANGGFLRHLRANGFESYQDFFEIIYPDF